MKKILLVPAAVFCMSVFAQAQNDIPPPPPPKPPESPKFVAPKVVADDEVTSFYQRNVSVKNLSWKSEHVIILKLKDGTKKQYNMLNEKEKKAFTDQYGEAPVPPPPPPPPAPPTGVKKG